MMTLFTRYKMPIHDKIMKIEMREDFDITYVVI